MAVPNTFATRTGSIPLNELDANFATPITIGTTAVTLGDSAETITGLTLVTPALGTPSTLVGTNITGTATAFTASNVTTNANLTGAVTSVGNTSSLGSFTSLQLATALTDETGTGANVFATSPTLVTPVLGTPTSGTLTNCTLPQLSASTGSTLVGTIQSGTGAVTRTVASKLNDTVSVKDFGAVGNGVTDDTLAIQAAINSLTRGETLYVPSGNYKVSGLTVPLAINIIGEGRYTRFTSSSATADIFSCTDGAAYQFKDLILQSLVTRTAGAYIDFYPLLVGSSQSRIENVTFASPYVGISFVNSAQFSVSNCYFASYVSSAIYINNILSPDNGDSNITASVFDGGIATGTAIYQVNSGGLRVTNNKFLHGDYHYYNSIKDSSANTSILIFTGNSSESALNSHLFFYGGNGRYFSRIIIADNQFSVISAEAVTFTSTDALSFYNVTIANNNLYMAGVGVGFRLYASDAVSIQNNILNSIGTTTGLLISATVTNCTIAPQTMVGVTTPYSGTLTGVTFTPSRIEKGTVSAVTNIAYGNLYVSTVQTVTFAQVYGKAPSVTVTGGSGGGSLTGIINTPTTSGFTVYTLGVTNGGSASVFWQAEG